MPDLNASSAVDTFMQQTTQADMRGTGLGIPIGSGALNWTSWTLTGAFTCSMTITANTAVTFPTSGTLATLAGSETLTNKTLTSAILTTPAVGSAGATFAGSSSGTTTLKAAAAASGTLTLPAVTDTLVGLTASQTLTNKTFVAPSLGVATCASMNGLVITSGGQIDLQSNNFTVVDFNVTLTATGNTDVTLPTTGTLATLAGTETFTNKTLTSAALTTPTIGGAGATFSGSGSGSTVLKASAVASGTLTLPAATDTVAVLAAAQTLSNKTFVAPVLGVATCTSLNDFSFSTSGTPVLSIDNDFTLQSGFTLEFVQSGNTTVTLPTSGTLASLAGAEALSNKTITASTIRTTPTAISGDGALTIAPAIYMITKGSAAALSLAAPSSVDGTRITITSTTNFAHVITFTGSTLYDGTSGANITATMAAFAGASITVIAYGSVWYVESFNAVTIA